MGRLNMGPEERGFYGMKMGYKKNLVCHLVYTGFVGDPLCSSMENNVHSLFFLGLTIKGSIQFSDITYL